MKTNRSSRRWALTLTAAMIAAATAGCTATGVTGAPAPIQVTQAPQQVATPTPVASAPAAGAPTTAAAAGKTGTPLPVTFIDPAAGWFTATVTPAAPQLAGDQVTLLQQPPVAGSWASVYVTRVTVTVTAVSKPNAEFATVSLNQLGLMARAGTGIQTATTALASPPGCAPLASPLRPAVGEGISVCLTTYSAAAAPTPTPTPTPQPTGAPALTAGPGLDVTFTPAGATAPVVIWATDSSIPPATYQ